MGPGLETAWSRVSGPLTHAIVRLWRASGNLYFFCRLGEIRTKCGEV
jgi:hypothetical protein